MVHQRNSFTTIEQNIFIARKLFFPAPREPVCLPDDRIDIPLPPNAPSPPPALNLWTTLIPPVLMLGGIATSALLNSQNPYVMIPMVFMGLGFPLANWLGTKAQKQKYVKELKDREKNYQHKLDKIREEIETLALQQRKALEDAYPNLEGLRQIALSANKYMWSRRPSDEDFLTFRIGWGSIPPSFSINLPHHGDSNDPLFNQADQLAREYKTIEKMPFLLNLGKIGSLAINGRSKVIYPVIFRLIVDLLIHHSPQDVRFIVFSDTPQAIDNWEWLKWVPHTDALNTKQQTYSLAFDSQTIDKALKEIMEEYSRRREAFITSEKKPTKALVVIVDDLGSVRQSPDMCELAENGWEVSIYPIFIGGRDFPVGCRARLDIHEDLRFCFAKTSGQKAERQEGFYEKSSREECEKIARAIACWRAPTNKTQVSLPEQVRLSKVLGMEAISQEGIQSAWSMPYEPKDLLQFPIGVYTQRDHLELAVLNFLDQDRGGAHAFHAILIGSTGSGKSEFMKSLILGAAIRYSPKFLNFFIMDFKGGNNYQIFTTLPHLSGFVTNLDKNELVERVIDSILNEIDRRQAKFTNASKKDIWDYNEEFPNNPLPHLILFLDEFTRGLTEFPRLREPLDVLVRQGRSLGMHLILANQSVNAEVDKLLENVGWRIALMVKKPEEMHFIKRGLPSPTRPGQGYLYLSGAGEIIVFQAGYGGYPVQNEEEFSNNFLVYEVKADGSYQEIENPSSFTSHSQEFTSSASLKEEDVILLNIHKVTEVLHIPPAKKIYLDPLPPSLSFTSILEEAKIKPAYLDGKWINQQDSSHIIVPWGKLDFPELSLQKMLIIDFDEKDGHLWITGAPGSGVGIALSSLLMMLALTHTPDQVQFYIIDLATGELSAFETLPHTGAIIYPNKDVPQENERLERLLNMLEWEMQKRSQVLKETRGTLHGHPSLFVIINSFAELRINFPNLVDRLASIARDGKKLGIHLIITTSRRSELHPNISSIISRRLVLKLSNKDEYTDTVGKNVAPITENVPGRGYWIDDRVAIVQIVSPPNNLEEYIHNMRMSWKGQLPVKIEILPDKIPLSHLLQELKEQQKSEEIYIPIGKKYDTLETISLSLHGTPSFLILGPKGSGKSNFLSSVLLSVLKQDSANKWELRGYTFRQSPISELRGQFSTLTVLTSIEEIIRDFEQLIEILRREETPQNKPLLLVIDDLGFAFHPERGNLTKLINDLGTILDTASNVVLIASGLLEELRVYFGTPLVKYLRQNRTGLVLSKDPSEVEWLGVSPSTLWNYRQMELPTGRGFFIYKGHLQFVHTPYRDKNG
ncbi:MULTISPECIES: FtsK/SpoIIIE domain-containing protein [Anaerolinea]|uniref:FtsK/SpoIIIE family protein n=1 Tax=Anaerolinea thermophila (strain DSM 14523 / JCM 11388 / NBRC 100420 / UNI-1) TaxID=926569 RepID=E8MZS8_ANATU|nr:MULTISPECIES: FtsK/SpoIIIE domain-containing protein [Anaerolinea]BAJ64626.1 FtsK/SpoIIIE family protein [Anaerolinea thermophila UNI-1]